MIRIINKIFKKLFQTKNSTLIIFITVCLIINLIGIKIIHIINHLPPDPHYYYKIKKAYSDHLNYDYDLHNVANVLYNLIKTNNVIKIYSSNNNAFVKIKPKNEMDGITPLEPLCIVTSDNSVSIIWYQNDYYYVGGYYLGKNISNTWNLLQLELWDFKVPTDWNGIRQFTNRLNPYNYIGLDGKELSKKYLLTITNFFGDLENEDNK